MKEIIEYKKSLENKDLEGLLNELLELNDDRNYHRFCSKNDKLKKECEDKIFIVKMLIIEKYDK